MKKAVTHDPLHYALAFQKGEEKGLAWFFRQLYPSLSFFACKFTHDRTAAEEIASQAFLKTWKKHHLFSHPDSIRAYLYQVTKNDCLKWINKQKKLVADQALLAQIMAESTEKDHYHALVQAETLRLLHQSIQMLPPECGKVFRLLFIEGKSVKETAETLKVSASTVKTQKKRGLDVLKARLYPGMNTMLLFALLSFIP